MSAMNCTNFSEKINNPLPFPLPRARAWKLVALNNINRMGVNYELIGFDIKKIFNFVKFIKFSYPSPLGEGKGERVMGYPLYFT